MKPVIHFAHANGVPSKVYEPLFEHLRSHAEVVMVEPLGATKGYPVTDNWEQLVQQVIDSIERQASVPVIGLGHSLGALCTYLAAVRRPDLFSQIIVMDPPMIMGPASFYWDMAKRFAPKLADKFSPAGLSKHRRDVWESKQQAFDLLKDKALFKRFHPKAFELYIEHGLRETRTGEVTLRIPKDQEVAVFRTNPAYFWRHTPKPKVEVLQLVGDQSPFIKRGFPQRLKKRVGVEYQLVKGGHMFPLEQPKLTAEAILKQIQAA